MAKRWRPAKKLRGDKLIQLPGWRKRSWYRASLSMAAIGWSRLLETFRRPKLPARPELPRAAAGRRRKI
jgi:hypothetical protein